MHSFWKASLSLVFLFFTGCSYFEPFNTSNESYVPEDSAINLPPPVLSVHAEEITGIIQDYSVELRNLKRLHLEHANTYYNEEGIHTIQIRFSSQDIIEICQARKLIIDVSEGLLDQLNSNPLLVPESSFQGFYSFNLEIYINFESYFIKYVDPFYVKWICMEDDKILYYLADVDENEKKGWHYRKESYKASRDIVFYQRLAEDKYMEMHEPSRTIFENKRYYPIEQKPYKVLE